VSAFGESLRVGSWFCVGAHRRNLASVAAKMFSHSVYFKNKFYKCTFSAICKDNAAINCTAVDTGRDSFPSTVTGHTLF
jgi:hypothetical protein